MKNKPYFSAEILLDSVSPSGCRLTTFLLSYARFVHAELMTHRVFSRNSASSRAIPTRKLIKQVISNPAHPVWWGQNQAGMQARKELTGLKLSLAKFVWFGARYPAILFALLLQGIGLHKQIANRILEPWMVITVIVTATEYDNFFKLRTHKDAQPEIGVIAIKMKELYDASVPVKLEAGQWHLPLISEDDRIAAFDFISEKDGSGNAYKYDLKRFYDTLKKISVAHCARVSYLTHLGKRDVKKDIELADSLAKSGHWSPFEHVAQAIKTTDWSGNFRGWKQLRQTADSSFLVIGKQ